MSLTLPPREHPVLDDNGLITERWYEALTRMHWQDYTPVMTSGTGTLTSAAGTGRWIKIDRLVFLSLVLGITTNGTAGQSIIATLPFTSAARRQAMSGLEDTGGKTLWGYLTDSTPTITIANYDGTYPGGSGKQLLITGCYEAKSAMQV